MPFLPETWKAKVTECLWEWRLRLEQAKPAVVYSALSAAALWPLVQAVQSTGMLPVALALGYVVAGVGGNLIAEQIQRWHNHRRIGTLAAIGSLQGWHIDHVCQRVEPPFGFALRSLHSLQKSW